jgi:hypothetical protein
MLWDEWLIFRLGISEIEYAIRLPFGDPFKEPEQEKPHRKRRLKARSPTGARGRN